MSLGLFWQLLVRMRERQHDYFVAIETRTKLRAEDKRQEWPKMNGKDRPNNRNEKRKKK